jgi:ketosteroid isomerase-like protein
MGAGRTDNVKIVRAMCEAFAGGDWAAGLAPLAPDIEWDTTTMGVWPEAEVVHGPDAVLAFFRRFLGTWDEYHAEFSDYAASGDHVVVDVHDGGRGKGSGVEVERSFTQLWTVRDGAVIRFRAYPDRASAEAAARA